MGVRIDFFVVDVGYAEFVAQQTLRNISQSYIVTPCHHDNPPVLSFINKDATIMYDSMPGEGLHRRDNRGSHPVTHEETAQVSFLAQTLRSYLAQSSSFDLINLFPCFNRCSDVDWIQQISSGNRRWWIGSFLEAIQTLFGREGEKYQKVAVLLRKTLRQYDCGTPLPASQYGLADFDFPLMVGDDTDLWMSIWNNEDISFWLEILNEIPAGTRFMRPTGKTGISPRSDNEWNTWVWQMLQELLKLKDVPYRQPSLITFIG